VSRLLNLAASALAEVERLAEHGVPLRALVRVEHGKDLLVSFFAHGLHLLHHRLAIAATSTALHHASHGFLLGLLNLADLVLLRLAQPDFLRYFGSREGRRTLLLQAKLLVSGVLFFVEDLLDLSFHPFALLAHGFWVESLASAATLPAAHLRTIGFEELLDLSLLGLRQFEFSLNGRQLEHLWAAHAATHSLAKSALAAATLTALTALPTLGYGERNTGYSNNES